MRVEYQLTIKDLKEALESHRRTFKIMVRVYLIVLGIIIILFGNQLTVNILVIGCGLLLIFLGISLPIFEKRAIKKQWESTVLLREYCFLEITDEYIFAKNSLTETKNSWKIYLKFRETKNLFLLYGSNVVIANIIPKSAFLNYSDREDFKKLALEKIQLNQKVSRNSAG